FTGALKDVWDFTESYLLTVWQNRVYVYTTAAVLIGACFTVNMLFKKKKTVDPVSPWLYKSARKQELSAETEKVILVSGVKVFYGSQTGTAKGFAKELSGDVSAQGIQCEVIDMKEYDPEDRLAEECTSKMICVFLVATYTDGQPTESTEWFSKWLEEASTDFRYGKTYLKGMRYAVFGLGNSVYVGHYNTVRHTWIFLSIFDRIVLHLTLNIFSVFRSAACRPTSKGEKKACSGKCKKGSCKNKKKHKEEAEDSHSLAEKNNSEELMESSSDAESSSEEEEKSHGSVIDVEDLGNVMNRMKKAKRMDGDEEDSQRVKLSKQNGVRKSESEEERREMITPALRDALTKQGYKLIGSHSGVKLCRWTKSMLRGRGGCYKHTFYGIESHRRMETTPSLACANKCVFCWRHHTNPVGTEWRWKMDPAEKIIQAAVENHRNMIRQFRGVPGVRPERFEEGLTVKHCALSLLGEPIMYPDINSFLRLLHQQNISSFLVTNAQFPEEIRSLVPVTQLYVSIDASTKDNFWQRFLDSLRALGEKVGPLCCNPDKTRKYIRFALGQPDFIEVKVLLYHLLSFLPLFFPVCLQFKVDGEWWTWIDYECFQELIKGYEESGGTKSFSAMDYMAKTPSWAIFGARERGFDPSDTRFQRKNKTKDISGC
uniref:tRNA 4-demethylwyosine synthase (AdoMet-dependent) n=1 Tax=Cyprinus carpio TaxID=7962 RepID=A0A8C2KMI1_CYPCA